MEFRQTPRGRGFLIIGYSCLKFHEKKMGLEVVRHRMAVYFSPKEMGLNA